MNTPNQTPAGFVRRMLLTMASLALLASSTASAQVPTMISYQGRVLMNNTNFGGTGQFKFALVQGAGPTLLWKNDGSAGNTEPAAAISLPVANGLVMTTLGDTALANMTAIPASVFEQPDVRLRVWFNGGAGFQQLTPDQRIASVGYALMSATVPDGSITAAKLANNAITSAKISDGSISTADLAPSSVNTGHIIDGQVMTADLANNAVTTAKVTDGSLLGADLANGTIGTAQLANSIALGASNAIGRLDVYRTTAGTPGVSIVGSSSSISTYGSDGLEQIRLHGSSWGELFLYDQVNNDLTVTLSASGLLGDAGGILSLSAGDGTLRTTLAGGTAGGGLILRDAAGVQSAYLRGDQGGRIDTIGSVNVMSTIGGDVWSSLGKNGSGGGVLRTYDEAGDQTIIAGSVASGGGGFINVHMNASIWPGVVVDGDDGNSGQILIKRANNANGIEMDGYNGLTSEISLFHTNGVETVEIIASEGGTTGAQILMRNAAGVSTIQLDSDASGVACGYLALSRSNGVANIILNAEDGTLRGQVVEITGGSDFSEKFDIGGDAFEPGMIVSIDPKNPGQLALTTAAHDKKVAGIVSGAGGVKPGMLMGQRGSVADGKHPVALSGRVYCWVDADANGAIEPGDMLTTSATPGHGMKVTDHARAVGAIVGKAMTSLAKGKGLVLVLVNLQ